MIPLHKYNYLYLGRVANPRPVAKIKTGLVSQPITDADDETGRDRSCIATRPCICRGRSSARTVITALMVQKTILEADGTSIDYLVR